MRRAFLLAVALLAAACTGPQAGTNQCRARMNVLSTDMVQFRASRGRWATTLDEVDAFAGRAEPLVCPSTGEEYVLEPRDDGYVLRCPGGLHGSVDTGRPDWGGLPGRASG
jgi:hypothetical protein